MLSKLIRIALIPSVSVLVLGGCQSIPRATPIDLHHCKPAAPLLESYQVDGGGLYYPERSVTNLMLYIEQLNQCIDYHQARPG